MSEDWNLSTCLRSTTPTTVRKAYYNIFSSSTYRIFLFPPRTRTRGGMSAVGTQREGTPVEEVLEVVMRLEETIREGIRVIIKQLIS